MADNFHCIRRLDGFPVVEWPHEMRAPKRDSWRDGYSMVYEHPSATPCCSYCGSMHPEKLLELLRAGGHIGGSDKPYKWYIHTPMNEDEKRQFEERKAAGEYGSNAEHAWMFEHGAGVGKFYTVHLNKAQTQEILKLWDDGKLNHSMYVRPWLPALNSAAPEWFLNQ